MFVVIDGNLGPKTIGQLQRHMHTPVDGEISLPVSAVVKALQKSLNAQRKNAKQF